MCAEVIIDKEHFETVGELKAKLGELVYDGEPYGDEYCLCSVDKEATAKLHGYILGTNYMNFFFLKEGEPLPKNVQLSK
jgi:hypothetical protein